MWHDCCSCFSLANHIVYTTLILHKLKKVHEWSALVISCWIRLLLWDLKHQSNWCRCLGGSYLKPRSSTLPTKCGFFHAIDRLWDTCNLNFMVSSVTIYNIWCLLWHILYKNCNLTLVWHLCNMCVMSHGQLCEKDHILL
jgi:hypothetical protein